VRLSEHEEQRLDRSVSIAHQITALVRYREASPNTVSLSLSLSLVLSLCIYIQGPLQTLARIQHTHTHAYAHTVSHSSACVRGARAIMPSQMHTLPRIYSSSATCCPVHPARKRGRNLEECEISLSALGLSRQEFFRSNPAGPTPGSQGN
jgi:hypothetical protein